MCADSGGLPLDDCDDCDENVFGGQTAYFAEQRRSGGYDYDCNGTEEYRYTSSQCEGLLGCGRSNIFLSSGIVPCGESHEFGDCLSGIVCSFSRDIDRQQTCR